jgi:predicted nucleotidyltransferase
MGRTVSSSESIAEPNTIVRVVVGSTVHGLAIEGTDDRDEMGVCLEPPEYVIGLNHFEQWVYRDKPVGVRSEPGDLDLTVYGARKYVRLLLGGNPTILLLLFVPKEYTILETRNGASLRIQGSQWISRRAGFAFLGYLNAQKERLAGERGQKRVNRPELVEKYGYDTKYAGHVIRLGYQGIELMNTGRISLPMKDPERTYVREIRGGAHTLEAVLARAAILEAELKFAIDKSILPEESDFNAANKWLYSTYEMHWDMNGLVPYYQSLSRSR